eukprot:NODE_22_length_42145_cov_1.310612.p5 type:complete len:593 gc:universal NODE_22_length_42145_cov_1.310612:16108-17886(+)
MNENDLQKLLTIDLVDEGNTNDDELLEDFENLKNGQQIQAVEPLVDDDEGEEILLEEPDTSLPHESGDFLIKLETGSRDEVLLMSNEYKLNAIQQKKLGNLDLAMSYMKGLKLLQEKIKELEPLKLDDGPHLTGNQTILVKPEISVRSYKPEPILDKQAIERLNYQVELSLLYSKIFLRLQDKTNALYFHRLSKLSQSALDHYPVTLSSNLVEWKNPACNPFVAANTIQVEIIYLDGIVVQESCEVFILVDLGPPNEKPYHFTHGQVIKQNGCSKKYSIESHLDIKELFHFQIGSRIRKPLNLTLCKIYPLRFWEYVTGPRVEKVGKITIDINKVLKSGNDAVYEWSGVLQFMDSRKPTSSYVKVALRTHKLLNGIDNLKKSETWIFEQEQTRDETKPLSRGSNISTTSNLTTPNNSLASPITSANSPASQLSPNSVTSNLPQPVAPRPIPNTKTLETTAKTSNPTQVSKINSPQVSPVGHEDDPPEELLLNPEHMTSNLVFEHYLKIWSQSEDKQDEVQQIQLKVSMLGVQVSTGKLTMEKYGELLNSRLDLLKKVAKKLRESNNVQMAPHAIIQIKSIQQELEELKQMQK